MGRSPGFEGTACAVDRFTFPSDAPSGCLAAADLQVGLTEATVPRYSGGTAPDSHRTSPLCPSWAPKAASVISRHGSPSDSITALLLGAGTASAHRAFSQDFDHDKQVTLNGTVTKVQWMSPHVYTWMDVKDDKGKTTNWKVEMGSPASLTRAGWTRNKLKVGEMVTLQGWRAKNGTNFANAEDVTMPDGTKLSAASSADRGAAVATGGTKTPKPAR